LENVVACLLRREPGQRYGSADRLLADLLMLGQGIAPGHEPPMTPSRSRSIPLDLSSLSLVWDAPKKPARPSRRAVAAVALVAGMAAGVVVQRQWLAPVAHAEAAACPIGKRQLAELAASDAPPLCLPPADTTPARGRPVAARAQPRQRARVVQAVDTEVPVSPLP
jgi:hypothetical protein